MNAARTVQWEWKEMGEVTCFIIDHSLTQMLEESVFYCARLPVNDSGLIRYFVKAVTDCHLFSSL